MSWGVANVAMLGGLAGVAIPVAIHLLSRRDEPVVDWAAMRFLELAPSQRRRIRFADALLMLARMLPLALVAIALSRPFWMPAATNPGTDEGVVSGSSGRRDVILILDGSSSMGSPGDDSPHHRAIEWARRYVGTLAAGDSVAVLVAGNRIRPLIDPPAFDLVAVDRTLAETPASRGSGDLPAAVGDAFRILGRGGNTSREVVILTDGRRVAWRVDEPGRWALLRDLQGRMSPPPRIWVATFPSEVADTTAPDGSVGPITVSRAKATPGMSIEVGATIDNAGPGEITRTVELIVDDRPVPGSSRAVGPIPPGGRSPVSFTTQFDATGEHLVTVRLDPGPDPRPDDDASSRLVAVAQPLRVLLIDGERGSGATAFMRAALAPSGDRTPAFAATTTSAREFRPALLDGQDVAIVADLATVAAADAMALTRFVETGGGLLLVPGPGANARSWEKAFGRDLLPAAFGAAKGDPTPRRPPARLDPKTFLGPIMAPLGGGDAPALGTATFFAHLPLDPASTSSVLARLDNGDPWLVGRSRGRGQVALVATALDAAAGTLVANPDFVPWVHEMITGLASMPEPTRPRRVGEALTFNLDPPPPPDLARLPLTLPSGRTIDFPIVRAGTTTQVTYLDADEPGVYRLMHAGRTRYAVLAPEPGQTDPKPLSPEDRTKLAAGWPLAFLDGSSPPPSGSTRPARREFAPWLILVVLAGLCVEIFLTRRLARSQGHPGLV